MERKVKLAKGVAGDLLGQRVLKPLGTQHILPPEGKAARKRNREAATGKPRRSSSAEREEDRRADSYEEHLLDCNGSDSASSSESDGEEDELQFVGGAGAERVRNADRFSCRDWQSNYASSLLRCSGFSAAFAIGFH